MKKRKTTSNQKRIVFRPFDHLPDDLVRAILVCISDDPKSLTRCLVVDKRLHALVTKSETVAYPLSQSQNVTLDEIMRLFTSVRHIRLQVPPFLTRFFPVRNSFTRWKAVASTRGLLYVMVLVNCLMATPPKRECLLPFQPVPSFSLPQLQPSSRSRRVPQITGPFPFLDNKVDEVAASAMLELREHLVLGSSFKSLTIWVANDGRLVIGEDQMREIESDLEMEYDLCEYYEMPLHSQHWSILRMELPLNNRIARVKVAVVKRSHDPIELDKDVLLLVDAFKDDEVDPIGGLVNEVAMEISKEYKEMQV